MTNKNDKNDKKDKTSRKRKEGKNQKYKFDDDGNIIKKKVKREDSDYESELDEKGNIKDLIDYECHSESSEEESLDEESPEESLEDDEEDLEEDFGNQIKLIIDTVFLPYSGDLEQLNGKQSNGKRPVSKKDKIKDKIENSQMSQDLKRELLDKLENSNLDEKMFDWFEKVVKIPFGVYTGAPINIKKDNVEKYFKEVMENLDQSVYGLKSVKEEVINYVAQTLTSKNPLPRVLSLYGGPGIGKTKIIRDGLSKSLNRPMKSFSMGGIKDSSHFLGFDYTYHGSRCGALIQAIIDSKTMDPIIFMDELDKISSTHEGEEIENLLIHLTDPVQNNDFKDKYFSDISIDLSKVIFIFAFNDIHKINPVLKDRLHLIKIDTPSVSEKLIIAKNYLIKELLGNIALKTTDFSITDEAIIHVISKYCENDMGVRNLKRILETLLLKLNMLKLIGVKSQLPFIKKLKNKMEFPIKIDVDNIDNFLEAHQDKNTSCEYRSMYM